MLTMRHMLILTCCLAIIPTFSQGQDRATKAGETRVAMPAEANRARGAVASAPPASSQGGGATAVWNGAGATRAMVATRPVGATTTGSVTNAVGATNAISAAGTVQAHPTGNVVIISGGPRFAPNERSSDFAPVPGLGFDYPHLAATRGAGAVNAGLNNQGFITFVPIFDSGIVLPSVADVVSDPAVNQVPQVISSEPADVAERIPRHRVVETPPATPTIADAAPAREAGDYLFVRRDGTIFFAVAYTWDNQTLRYITREGLRRSIARDGLDLDATQQFNEQR
ncbi:MAG TPA: hypothetical protein VOA64_09785 [Candidatus Dormibacteraeota bacterium]|nr:hypothetical protein [Candidatus Dormibacteraeota bacterium]